MKRLVIGGIGAVVVVLAGFAGTILWEVNRSRPEPRPSAEGIARFEVPRGQPFALIATRLEAAGYIRRARPLVIYAAITRADRQIHSGIYEFGDDERPVDILRRLTRGEILRIPVTIPEGYTMWEIATAFAPAGIDSVAMVDAIEDPSVRQAREIPAPTLEGYLFPDTYRVAFGTGARDAVRQMLSRLDEMFDADLVMRAAEVEMTPHEVLTLASIVEAEARVPSERPTIAAVYHNRLRRGMRLEADPTVAYAMGGYRGRLLYKDLEIESPYNTYRNRGLPPGPICSPGIEAIRATLYPDSTVEALYFVARGDGSHIFSKTHAEHEQAVREVRAARKSGSK